MRNTLLRMLAALMCVMAACAQDSPVADFDPEKMAGKWYIVGFASNAQWFVTHKAEMKMGTAVVVPIAGDLDLTYANLKADGTCWRMNHLAKKTDTPGRFTFHSQIWNNDNDMRVVDVVYDDYALVHTIKTKEEAVHVLDQLYSRTPHVSDVLQQKFTQLSLDHGILSDNIAFLPLNGECAEAEATPAAAPEA